MSRSGKIISIEGIDAVGKQTQTKLLESWLKKGGFVTWSLSFPDYETGIGKEIRAFLSGERDFLPELRHILFAANRWEKVPDIKRHQETDDVVVINRYSESNLVYGTANGLSLDWLRALEEGIPKADLVLVLDAPEIDLLSRRPGEKDKYEKDSELQLRARRIYRELASKFGWTLIDASGEIETVHRSVTRVVERKMLQWSSNQR